MTVVGAVFARRPLYAELAEYASLSGGVRRRSRTSVANSGAREATM